MKSTDSLQMTDWQKQIWKTWMLKSWSKQIKKSDNKQSLMIERARVEDLNLKFQKEVVVFHKLHLLTYKHLLLML